MRGHRSRFVRGPPNESSAPMVVRPRACRDWRHELERSPDAVTMHGGDTADVGSSARAVRTQGRLALIHSQP
jgi:hypothetical protein